VCFNLGITFAGMQALGIPESTTRSLPEAYREALPPFSRPGSYTQEDGAWRSRVKEKVLYLGPGNRLGDAPGKVAYPRHRDA